MRWLLWLALSLGLGVGVALLAARDPGYLLIHWAGWQVEIRSLVVALLIALLGFVVLHWLFNTGTGLRRLGKRLAERRRVNRFARARESLVEGLQELRTGHLASAERHLLREVTRSETPLLHYLAAAQAAELLGALDRRDLYLTKAQGAGRATELVMGAGQGQTRPRIAADDLSLATVKELSATARAHPQVLKLLLGVYVGLNQWRVLLRVLPTLIKCGALSPAEADELRRQCYLSLLRASGEPNKVWAELPRRLTTDPVLLDAYAGLLGERQAADTAMKLIERYFRKHWDARLVARYGQLVADDVTRHLLVAERWLKRRPEDPTLFLTLAQLCRRSGRKAQARAYVERSIELQPTPQAHQEFGQLLYQIGDTEAALRQFRLGLDISVANLARAGPSRPAASPCST